ncbi:MAG: ferritin-like protein [Candidatus Eremiobacteraeota bacterium]|nr:ferritin-like protein [Candidatus Eremiobacteraeota bacterium]
MGNTDGQAAAAKDLAWIQGRLQDAIALEYSTQPLYLAAMFSLKVQNYTAYNWIRAVVMEEMVHMGIAANILAAIGGAPQIAKLCVTFPSTGLPGGAEPDLVVGPARYSPSQLENFLRIECPSFLLDERRRDQPETTISGFYSELREAIVANRSAVNAAAVAVAKKGPPPSQVGDNIGLPRISAVDGDIVEPLCAAIQEIVEQGEGTAHGSLITGPRSEGEKSHFVRFAELYFGREYEHPHGLPPPTRDELKARFSGMPIHPPGVINTLAVPKDAYATILAIDPNAAAAQADLDAFDTQLSAILAQLDTVWNGPPDGSWKTLGGAVAVMMKLRVISCFNVELHEIPRAAIAQLRHLYPDEYDYLDHYTDLKAPCFYGPRFINKNCAPGGQSGGSP